MKITLSLMAKNNVSQDPVNIPHQKTDELFLDFQVDGCFCATTPNDFTPALPNYFCTKKTYPGPYRPHYGDHNTQYGWDTTENCECKTSDIVAMHTIHTGN